MKQHEILSVVISTIEEFLDSQGIYEEVKDNSKLIGSESLLDSLGLVNIIVDLESKMHELGYEISIMSEKAMSMKISPFKSVATLTDFISDQLDIYE